MNGREQMFDILTTKYIVFSGGAAKGYAHLGALDVLKNVFMIAGGLHLVDYIDGYGGASFGAIVALACSLGLDLSVINDWFMSVDTTSIVASMNIMNFYDTKGLIKHTYLQDNINNLLQKRFGSFAPETMTLSYLYKRTRKILKIVVSNVSTCSVEIWDHKSQPDMCVTKAIIASTAVPFIFEPMVIPGRGVYLDGGLFHNYPVDMFPANKVIGIKLKSPPNFVDFDQHGLQDYMMRVIGASSEFYEHAYYNQLSDEYKKRTIVIDVVSNISSLELLNPPIALKQELIAIGKQYTALYFFNPDMLSLLFLFAVLHEMLKAWIYFDAYSVIIFGSIEDPILESDC